MDIEEHLALHDSAIKAWVWANVGIQGEWNEDAHQNIILAMIEAHEGSYDHSCQLLTYIWSNIRGIAFRGYDSEYRYGLDEGLNMLQEIALEQGRDRLHLEPLYDSPIPGLKAVLESSLSPKEQAQAEKLMADQLMVSLTNEDLMYLDISVGRSERQAAAMLGVPKSTYRYRLARARERAVILLKLI
jgi:hypothetical protein